MDRRHSLRDRIARSAALLLSCSLAGAAADAQTSRPWPQFLGGSSDLRIEAEGLSRDDGIPGATVRWRQRTGPGYSQPAVGDGRLYVASSNDVEDVLVARSLDTGEVLWSYSIGPTWRGIDGSDDGPVSSPALGDGVVVGLGPRGQLFALRSADGRELWRVDLPGTVGTETPTYGVTSSPLIDGGLVLVHAGGTDGRSVVAFEVETGRIAWSSVDDEVRYHSPLIATLLGKRQLLAVTGTTVQGLDLVEGSTLWQARHLEKAETHANPAVVTGPDRFVVSGVEEAVGFELRSDGARVAAMETWRSRELKRTYAVPVFLDGTLYGWSGDFFAAIDASSGKRLWKTRGVGPGSVLALGDWLAVWTADGRLLFSEPSRDEYRVVADYRLADEGSLVNPAWTGDGLILRSRDELLAVDVSAGGATTGPATTTVTDVGIEPTGRFGAWLRGVRELDPADRAAAVEAYLSEQDGPVVEDDGVVTFLWRGPADDVALVPGGIPVETAQPMRRVEGTELWFRTEQLNLEGAYVYHFEVDGERPRPDTLNEQSARTMMPSALLTMPDFEMPPALAPGATPPKARGTVTDHAFRSDVMESERTVAVYTPAGYTPERRYPLVLVASGADRFMGRMTEILDASMGRTVEPAVVAFVDVTEPAGMNVFYESIGGKGPLFGDMLIQEIVPWLEENYSLSAKRDDRLIIGTMLFGSRALETALRYPQSFGAVAAQSPAMNPAFERELGRALTGDDLPRIYVDWCEKDSVAVAENTVVVPALERVLPKLRAAGAEVLAKELPGGYGWEMFSTQTEEILRTFLPRR